MPCVRVSWSFVQKRDRRGGVRSLSAAVVDNEELGSNRDISESNGDGDGDGDGDSDRGNTRPVVF